MLTGKVTSGPNKSIQRIWRQLHSGTSAASRAVTPIHFFLARSVSRSRSARSPFTMGSLRFAIQRGEPWLPLINAAQAQYETSVVGGNGRQLELIIIELP